MAVDVAPCRACAVAAEKIGGDEGTRDESTPCATESRLRHGDVSNRRAQTATKGGKENGGKEDKGGEQG